MQNRVTPFGDIVALAGRGTMMGNRGVLHDDAQHIVRAAQVRRWIACVLEFRGRYRKVMQPRRYTELFFLDEATSLSAGHRPCAECRNADYRRFRTLWELCHAGPASADVIDRRLETERRARGTKRTFRADVATLPDGTYVSVDGAAWLVRADRLHRWSDTGYRESRSRPAHGAVEVLTPPSIVAVLAAGYAPGIHPTASAVP
ncbi:MAG TPA: hypothetical protein VGP41_01025 [Candidatus Lustribacter sp.]|nr:hypothetical protein [Candidatus Lustribacter sp.]